MKHKTLFRLALKMLGVYFVINSGAWIIGAALPAGVDLFFGMGSTTFVSTWRWTAGQLLANGIQFGCGIYLFRRGHWIVDRAIPSNRPYCPECAYELTGLQSNCCPECGTALPLGTEPTQG